MVIRDPRIIGGGGEGGGYGPPWISDPPTTCCTIECSDTSRTGLPCREFRFLHSGAPSKRKRSGWCYPICAPSSNPRLVEGGHRLVVVVDPFLRLSNFARPHAFALGARHLLVSFGFPHFVTWGRMGS